MFYELFDNNIIFNAGYRCYCVEPKAQEHADRVLEKCDEGVQGCIFQCLPTCSEYVHEASRLSCKQLLTVFRCLLD
jgi:hypothetical protein